jgi:hypothetical protein
MGAGVGVGVRVNDAGAGVVGFVGGGLVGDSVGFGCSVVGAGVAGSSGTTEG